MKKMLINARQPVEVRIATVENGKLLNIDIESIDYEQKKANIYKGIVTRVEPSLNAAFINYGEKRNGFLPFKEIAPQYFKKQVKDGQDIPLTELLDVGQEIIVQINKEERGTKGAALSTYITLAGCYLVLMPNNPDAGGISRRIEGPERQKLKELFDALEIPEEMGVIIRTAGVDRQVEEMQWDLNVLLNLWSAINKAYDSASGPFLIHSESDITVRAIRDHLKDDIEEIIIDDKEASEVLKRQLSLLRPDFVERVKLYSDSVPLFSKEQIESKIEEAYMREVVLPSGGSIVIDAAEALTAIDINSARATRGDNIEETAYFTNLEAAEEIARQLRLRDIGGLIVVDFIDMQDNQHQSKVEHALIDELAKDRAKVQMTRISRFGLVEISRQRLQSSLGESATIACPRCEGQGIIRSVPSLALSILRLIKEEAHKEKTNEIRVQLPISVATYLLNEQRDAVQEVESSLDFKLVLIPNPNLETPHYYIQRIWGDNYVANKSSYNLIEERKEDSENYIKPKKTKAQQPLVKSMTVEAAPKSQSSKEGLFKKIFSSLFGSTETQEVKKPKTKQQPRKAKSPQKQSNQQRKHSQQRHKDRDHSKDRDRRKSQQYGGQKGRKHDGQDNRNDRRSGSNKHQRHAGGNAGSRQNLYKSEDVVDVKVATKTNEPQKRAPQSTADKKGAQAKAKSKQTVIISADALVGSLNVKPLEFNTTSKLIKEPKGRVSKMVEQVLSDSENQSKTAMRQIETSQTPDKVKYLKFEQIDLAKLKSEQLKKEEEAKKAKKAAQQAKKEAQKAKAEYEKAEKLKAQEAQSTIEEASTEVKEVHQAETKPVEVSTPEVAVTDKVQTQNESVAIEMPTKEEVAQEAVISIDVSETSDDDDKAVKFDAEVEVVIDVEDTSTKEYKTTSHQSEEVSEAIHSDEKEVVASDREVRETTSSERTEVEVQPEVIIVEEETQVETKAEENQSKKAHDSKPKKESAKKHTSKHDDSSDEHKPKRKPQNRRSSGQKKPHHSHSKSKDEGSTKKHADESSRKEKSHHHNKPKNTEQKDTSESKQHGNDIPEANTEKEES